MGINVLSFGRRIQMARYSKHAVELGGAKRRASTYFLCSIKMFDNLWHDLIEPQDNSANVTKRAQGRYLI